jgi:hypothetical protein
MDRVLTLATIGKARRALAARLGRIEALAAFARASSGAEGPQFVDKLIAVLGELAWQGGARSAEALRKISDRATRHYEAEVEEAATAGVGLLDDDPDAATEMETYVERITQEALKYGRAYGAQSLRAGLDDGPLLRTMVATIFTEMSGPDPAEIASDALADLHHWCADRGLPLPVRPWS